MTEKTKPATPKQLRDAREKGQVGQSQDFSKVLVLLMVSEVTLNLAEESMVRLQRMLALPLDHAGEPFMGTVARISSESATVLISFILCSVGVAVITRMIGTWMQIGFLFAPKALAPTLERLSPLGQAKQMLSMQNLTTLTLSILKAAAIAITLYVLIKPALSTLILLAYSDLNTYWRSLVQEFRHILRSTLGLLLVIGVIDFAVQKYFHAKKMRTSTEDIQKEHKQAEGDPHVKGHRQQLARQLSNEAPSAPRPSVDTADLVIVNPTHYAVALYYRPGETPLPLIHRKGMGDEALDIIALAKRAKIPVIQSIWLARTLYKVNEGRYIPRPTLLAVAHIYQVVRQLTDVPNEVIRVTDA
ncbi:MULTISPECIES: type III secretion system export apparatus subunit SctU [Pseudomonas]|uniref:Type III secretion system export apparatus subunit SctU n=1 Tax=Pseudomonas wuhanensis TaxID=2954098 RepID=A0ABY9GLJ1_9PSED|nr:MULTISPECIES: type III secretion system export apparatus subunit SctU [unclassified Pseudomonas]WLI10713.1 type III secretion system export apparatus subunit SctU [Pseudomonas sp. FP603]WLI16529.1 type III secretion system export apparatus subunit SctU [Pseudomonas sp. FP607]